MRASALLIAVFCFACRPPEPPPPPELEALSPDSAVYGRSIQARLSGAGFEARVSADFDDGRRSQLALPEVAFVREGVVHGAKVQKLESARSLLLETPPELDPGRWTVRLTDGWGREVLLSDAFEVTGCSTAAQCDDGQPCTVDACTASACSHTPLADTTPCEDGDLCTTGDACAGGVCQSGPPTTCAAPSCHTAACEPATGACVTVVAPDDTACVDGYDCTGDDRCRSGACVGGASTCANTAPRACLRLSPVAAVQGADGGVTFNAACTSDLESPLDVLKFRFDFDGDGTFDTPFLDEPVATHPYPSAGLFEVSVEATDPLGLSGFASRYLSVGPEEADVLVTTAADEQDPGATPAAPGGTGLSLREAIAYANANGSIRRIRFERGLKLSSAALPALTAPGLWWVGEDDVELDFSAEGSGASCVVLGGNDQRLIAARLHACAGTTVAINGDGSSLSDAELWNGGTGVSVAGADAGVGPRVFVHDIATVGVDLGGPRASVDRLRLCRANEGIAVQTKNFPVTISRSVIWSNASAGVTVNPGGRVKLLASTVDGNGSHGVRIKANDAGIEISSSLITHSGQAGVQGAPTLAGPNGFFGNLVHLSEGLPDGGVLLEDPRYLSRVNGDFRLTPGSGAIDAGADVGLDLNGAAPGAWNGGAPDLGAEESPF